MASHIHNVSVYRRIAARLLMSSGGIRQGCEVSPLRITRTSHGRTEWGKHTLRASWTHLPDTYLPCRPVRPPASVLQQVVTWGQTDRGRLQASAGQVNIPYWRVEHRCTATPHTGQQLPSAAPRVLQCRLAVRKVHYPGQRGGNFTSTRRVTSALQLAAPTSCWELAAQ